MNSFISYIVQSVFVGIISYLLYNLYKWLSDYYYRCKLLDKVKHFDYIPILGNLQIQHRNDYLEKLLELAYKPPDEPIVVYWIGTEPWVFITKSDCIEVKLILKEKNTVLYSKINVLFIINQKELVTSSKYIEKSAPYKFLHPWLKTGLLTSYGEKWQKRRHLLTKSFHFDILKQYIPIINDKTNILIDKIDKASNQDLVVDIFNIFSLATLDIICETAMGTNLNLQTNENCEYSKAVSEINVIMIERMFSVLYQNDFIYNFFEHGKRHNKMIKTLHDFTRNIINERNAEYEKDINSQTNRLALLDLLLKHKHESSDISLDDIQEEVDTFMFEGHDTTAVGLSWTVHMIGTHFDIQKKLHEEIDNIFGSSNRSIDNEDLGKLKYLECVIKESLRLFPPVPITGRKVNEELKLGKYTIPKGSTACIFTYVIHRDENYYPNPNEFNPDRFLSENIIERHPFAYIPFSAGRRNCIGQRFALMEEKIVLASILRKFEIRSLKSTEQIKPVADLLLRPQNHILIKFISRNN